MDSLSQKLLDRVKVVSGRDSGISSDDIRRLQVSSDLLGDILVCLHSNDPFDQQIGSFFLECLVDPNCLNNDLRDQFVNQITQLVKASDPQVQATAYRLLWRFNSFVPDYRAKMLIGLKSSIAMVRKESLLAYLSYCDFANKEVFPLESFEFDDYLAETRMGGAMVYELRNLSFETIEKVLSIDFSKKVMSRKLPTGETVHWWDWKPYHEFKKRRRFWR